MPAAIAGYSLGNYAALVAAGAISFDDALGVLLRVLDLVHGLQIEGAMAAVVGMSEEPLREICEKVQAGGEWVEPANLNADNQIVVSGTAAGIDRFLELASSRCLRAIRLPMELPIHSRLMKPISDALRSELPGEIDVSDPRIPFFAASFGRRVLTGDEVLEILISQVERPSRWRVTVLAIGNFGVRRFVEIGSGSVLTRMLRWIDREASGFPVETPADFSRISPPLESVA